MWFLITAPGVLHNLFRSAGRRLELCLHLISLELTCRCFYHDGLAPDARHNHAHLIDEFAHLNAHDGAALRHFTHFTHFTNFARIIHQAAAGPFLYIAAWAATLSMSRTFMLLVVVLTLAEVRHWSCCRAK
jgi:hypothetical protein